MSTLLVADIGGTSVKLGFIVEGVPQAYVRLFPADGLRNHHPAASLAQMIATAMDEAKYAPGAIVCTVPGFLDKTSRHVLFAANLAELNGCALADQLAQQTGMPVTLERDAVLALMGEHAAGGCQGAESVAGIFFGTGVGAAFLEAGRAFRGSGWALEIGHMPYRGGRQWLGAGRKDCLETYVSGMVLEQIAQQHGVPIAEVFTAARHNAALAAHVTEFVHHQANAVGSAAALLSPATILLGGGICDMPGFPRERLAAIIRQTFPFEHTGQPLDLRWATLGWRSVLYGAPLAAASGRNCR